MKGKQVKRKRKEIERNKSKTKLKLTKIKSMKWKKLRKLKKVKKIKSLANIYNSGPRCFKEKSLIKIRTQNIYIKKLIKKLKFDSLKPTSRPIIKSSTNILDNNEDVKLQGMSRITQLRKTLVENKRKELDSQK